MVYQALYRKYRPRTFGAVVGQDAVVRTLKNQLATGRLSHAYLFCGTRGTGKTTMAKLLARAVNCEHPVDGEPCGVCPACQSILEGSSLNVLELDAASNNGVDNIRDLTEEVKYPPTQGNYKVYIIDEVHMLSTPAFNALLKTLEEPPAHVIFILATTDPQKIPPTILSRCQRFDFRRISVADMAAALSRVADAEGIPVQPAALQYLARLTEGSLRDGLSLLDQCAATFAGQTLTEALAESLVGAADDAVYDRLIAALAQRDSAACFALSAESFASGRDVNRFVAELLLRLRNLLVAQTLSDPAAILELSAESIAAMEERAGAVSREELLYFIQVFSRLAPELKTSRSPRILLEVELLRICTGEEAPRNLEALSARLASLERELKERPVTISAAPATSPAAVPAPAVEPPPVKKPRIPTKNMEAARAAWQGVLPRFSIGTQMALKAVFPGFWEENALYLICENAGVEGIVRRKMPELREYLEEALGQAPVLQTMLKKDFEERFDPAPAEDTALSALLEKLPDAEIEE